jgi:uncharacterized membrane protein
MKILMLQEDVIHVEERVKKFEDLTGCELLIVMARSSDEYPAASMRFGLIMGFAVTFIFSLFFEFHNGYFWPLFMLFICIGMTFLGKIDWIKRCALSDIESSRETTEKAIELFHTIGSSKVSHKVSAMIMVSILERKVIVLVDETLKKEMTQTELDELVNIMKPYFKSGDMPSGLIKSIEVLEQKILADFGGKVSQVNHNELSNQIRFL